MAGHPVLFTILGILVALALGILIFMQTSYFKVRKYAMDIKRVFDKSKLQEKVEAVQSMGQNPNVNPVLARKPLNELISTYKSLIADLEKVKVPAKVTEVHNETLTLHRESMGMYQLALVGGFRQKALMDKQRKVVAMEKSLQEKMEKIYGKPKEKKKK